MTMEFLGIDLAKNVSALHEALPAEDERMEFCGAIGIWVRTVRGATSPFVDVQSVPRVPARTAHAMGRNQEFKYRLDGVLTRWEVFVDG